LNQTQYNGCKWRGLKLRVEVARPRYSERLAAELAAEAAARSAAAALANARATAEEAAADGAAAGGGDGDGDGGDGAVGARATAKAAAAPTLNIALPVPGGAHKKPRLLAVGGDRRSAGARSWFPVSRAARPSDLSWDAVPVPSAGPAALPYRRNAEDAAAEGRRAAAASALLRAWELGGARDEALPLPLRRATHLAAIEALARARAGVLLEGEAYPAPPPLPGPSAAAGAGKAKKAPPRRRQRRRRRRRAGAKRRAGSCGCCASSSARRAAAARPAPPSRSARRTCGARTRRRGGGRAGASLTLRPGTRAAAAAAAGRPGQGRRQIFLAGWASGRRR